METTVGRRHLPGQAGDPDRRHRLRHRQDVGRPGAASPRPAATARRAVMVPTGQTGMMIEGWGVAVDRVISDFTNGTVEWLVEQGEARGDWVIVEGQGSIDHPAYSAVTLGLIHGATPHAMVMVHKPGLDRARLRPPARGVVPDRRARPVHRAARADRRAGRTVEGRGDRAQHLALSGRRRGAAGRSPRIAAETGLPADDPVRFGADRLWPAVRDARGRAAVGLSLTARGPVARPARPVPDRPLRARRQAPASRRSSSSCATTGSRTSSGWGRATRTGFYGETPADDGGRHAAAARRRSASRHPTSAA